MKTGLQTIIEILLFMAKLEAIEICGEKKPSPLPKSGRGL